MGKGGVMMREIKFRARSAKTSCSWVYGYFLINQFGEPTICGKDFAEKIIKETVGQYTGLWDKNNVDIYEGDILKRGETTDRVIFEDGAFCIRFYSKGFKNTYTKTMCEAIKNTRNRWEIIGNIYEHKHLLEEK